MLRTVLPLGKMRKLIGDHPKSLAIQIQTATIPDNTKSIVSNLELKLKCYKHS